MKLLKKLCLLLFFSSTLFSVKAFAIAPNQELDWYIVNRHNKETPEILTGISDTLKKTNSYFVGDTLNKELYLTFDMGYENGNTIKILDTLKEKNVTAAFFVVKSYILSNPDIIKRMVDEGHLVCNHSVKHNSMAQILNEDAFKKEFLDTEMAFKEVTGKEMPKYFRPPMGKYSISSLEKTKNLGYKTVFWSFAYRDWLVDAQPDQAESLKKIKSGMHNGSIVLLHSISKTNSTILPTLLDDLQKEGYTFKSLDHLPTTMVLTGDDKLKSTLSY